jgi:integrase
MTIHTVARPMELVVNRYWTTGATVSYELGCKPVPFEEIIKVVGFLPRGNPIKAGLTLLFLTGARMSELQNMTFNGPNGCLRGNWLYWRVGKNQGGQWRSEFIPDWALEELKEYWETHKLPHNHLYGWCARTLGRYFNRDVRPLLGPAWQEKVAVAQKGGIHEYVLQVKGLRKSFACLVFWQEWHKWKSASAAMEFTCKRLRHSNTGITVQHYLSSVDRLDMDRWGGFTPGEVLGLAFEQRKLADFGLNVENRQSRLPKYLQD